MPLQAAELFSRTMDVMVPGDTLMILGGTFPGPEDSAEIELGMQAIIPMLQIVTGSDNYPTRPNLFIGEEDPITLTLSRGGKKFGQDYGERGPDMTYGKRAGLILDLTVDLIVINPMTRDEFYFVGKPSPE